MPALKEITISIGLANPSAISLLARWADAINFCWVFLNELSSWYGYATLRYQKKIFLGKQNPIYMGAQISTILKQ